MAYALRFILFKMQFVS